MGKARMSRNVPIPVPVSIPNRTSSVSTLYSARSREPLSPTPQSTAEKSSCFEFFRQSLHSCNVFVIGGVLVVVVLLVAAITAMIVYFGMWRGMPTMDILGVDKAATNPKSGMNIVLGGATQPTLFLMNVTMMIEVHNPNLLDLTLIDIGVAVFHPLQPSIQIGNTAIGYLMLPKQSSTSFELPLMLAYAFNAQDPHYLVPKDLVASCTIPSGQTRPVKQLKVNIAISPTVRLTSAIKIHIPTLNPVASFDCPFTSSQTISAGPLSLDLATIDWSLISGKTT